MLKSTALVDFILSLEPVNAKCAQQDTSVQVLQLLQLFALLANSRLEPKILLAQTVQLVMLAQTLLHNLLLAPLATLVLLDKLSVPNAQLALLAATLEQQQQLVVLELTKLQMVKHHFVENAQRDMLVQLAHPFRQCVLLELTQLEAQQHVLLVQLVTCALIFTKRQHHVLMEHSKMQVQKLTASIALLAIHAQLQPKLFVEQELIQLETQQLA